MKKNPKHNSKHSKNGCLPSTHLHKHSKEKVDELKKKRRFHVDPLKSSIQKSIEHKTGKRLSIEAMNSIGSKHNLSKFFLSKNSKTIEKQNQKSLTRKNYCPKIDLKEY